MDHNSTPARPIDWTAFGREFLARTGKDAVIVPRTKSASTLERTKALVATVTNTKAVGDSGSGEFEAVISTPTLDRDGEIWDEGWWDPLPADIPIHVDHRFMDVGAVVARAVPFAEDGVLKVRGRYASTPKAQEIRTLVAEGMVTTMSIGAINATIVEKDGVPHCTSAELLEASFVSVPANADALVTSAKAGARNSSKDAERLQSIHDLAVENGAECAAVAKAVTLEAVTKTLDGSVEQYQDTLREALRDLHPGVRWLWLRGTFPDAGRVVYEVETEAADGSYEAATYQVTYSTTDDGTFTFDTPEEVDLAEVVVPAQNATTVDATARPAAPKAAGRAVAATAVAKAEADAALAALAHL